MEPNRDKVTNKESNEELWKAWGESVKKYVRIYPRQKKAFSPRSGIFKRTFLLKCVMLAMES